MVMKIAAELPISINHGGVIWACSHISKGRLPVKIYHGESWRPSALGRSRQRSRHTCPGLEFRALSKVIIRKILVPTDGSESAIRAKQFAGELQPNLVPHFIC